MAIQALEKKLKKTVSSIAMDFSNKTICIETPLQKRIEYIDINKDKFKDFYPSTSYIDNYNFFVWDFSKELFIVIQSNNKSEGKDMTRVCFTPDIIIPMPGLGKKLIKFLKCIDGKKV